MHGAVYINTRRIHLAQIPLVASRHETSRLAILPMHFVIRKSRTCCVAHAVPRKRDTCSTTVQHVTTSAASARHLRHRERDRRDTQLSLFVMCIKLWSP